MPEWARPQPKSATARRTGQRAPKELRRASGTEDYPEDVARPAVRGDCADGERPCPFVSCKFHLYLDVNPETGALKMNFPDREPDELEETCTLDVAAHDGATQRSVARLTNLTRERIWQIESKALQYIRYDATKKLRPIQEVLDAERDARMGGGVEP